ncbi:MAG: outer membrane beta-barrel protein [Gammaproteobacteria bacterium]|nr:outer membrane beta-barrel protein [Gammaproteobacteria bacterium]
MNVKISAVIVSGVLLLLVSAAHAGQQDDNPLYFGFGIGFPGSDEECDYYGYNCDGGDTSFKMYAGKRLHENFGVEISFQDLGKIRDDNPTFSTTAESEGINLSLHGIIPVGLGYFYGKAGYMLWDTKYKRLDTTVTTTKDDGADFTYGMGFAFLFDDKYDFRVEFERLNELGDDFIPGGSFVTVFTLSGTVYID